MDFNAGLQNIQDKAVKAAALSPVAIDDPRHKYFDNRGSALLKVDVPPPIRGHQVNTVADFIAVAIHANAPIGGAADDDAEGPFGWGGDPVIWHDEDRLVLIIDDGDRRERVTMTLETSLQLDLLRMIEEDRPRYDKAKLVRLIKHDLRGCVANDSELLASLSKIKFELSERSGETIARGRESLDADVKREAVGIDGLPEEVLVTIPIYANPGERASEFGVLCALDVDMEAKQFMIWPLPGEIEHVIDQAQAGIRERLDVLKDDMPVFNGKP